MINSYHKIIHPLCSSDPSFATEYAMYKIHRLYLYFLIINVNYCILSFLLYIITIFLFADFK